MQNRRILVVDDEPLFADAVAALLRDEGAIVVTAATLAAARLAIERAVPDVVVLDNLLPDGSGVEAAQQLAGGPTKVVLVTANPSVETAVKALREGVDDYLIKPVDLDELVLTITRLLHTAELERRVHTFERFEMDQRQQATLVGVSAAWLKIKDLVTSALESLVPVLITGESGTGKGVVARAIHYGGRRAGANFLAVNCAALPESLLEAELFGAERGAYTGAFTLRQGLFELANKGTLFLDEFTEIPIAAQAKLLGVLEDRSIRRIGGVKQVPIDTRIVAATNRDPQDEVRGGRLRSDLLWRLDVLRIHLPPLRDRLEDLEPLARHLLGQLAPARAIRLASGEVERLAAYEWPGNVRELRNVLERTLLVQSGAEIRPSQLLQQGQQAGLRPAPPAERQPPKDALGRSTTAPLRTLEEVEREHILAAWELHEHHVERTAVALGISTATLRRRLASWRDETACLSI